MDIGASMIGDYKTCPRLYYFAHELKLRPKIDNEKLSIGTGFHLGVAGYYRHNRSMVAASKYLNVWADELLQDYSQHSEDESKAREIIDMAVKCVGYYIDFAEANDNFDVIAVEQEFDLPVHTSDGTIMQGVRHKGTFDLITKTQHMWVNEHKTGASFPSTVDLNLSEQDGLYLLAATQLFSEPFRGCMHDVTRKIKIPSRTKDPLVKRFYVTKSPQELINIRNNLYWTIQRMLSDIHFVPSPGMHCNWRCAYTSLCMAMNTGDGWQEMADYYYETKTKEAWEARLDRIQRKAEELVQENN